MQNEYLIIDDFRKGWQQKEDDSKLPIGALRKSTNITITDRGGIAPRPQEELVGTKESETSSGVKSLYSFKKSDGADILIKTFDDKVKYYNNVIGDWCLLKDGYTSGLEFGFKELRYNLGATDLIYFGNGVEPFSSWCGYEGKLVGDVLSGATSVVVDSILQDSVIWSGTADSVTTTTIDIAISDWATDIWNNFYVRITSGTKEGYISKISATTATQITFDAIAGLTGTPTFEIRLLAIPETGSIVYNDDTVAYTAIPKDDTLTVGSAHAGSDGDGITVAPVEYPDVKRGNILETALSCMYVGGINYSPNTVYRSKTTDPTDYDFSSPRTAGEGDIVYFPYSGSEIKDLRAQENTLYVFKPHAIEALSYTQDGNDLSQIDEIIRGVNVGANGRTWRFGNDIAYATPDNRITTVGRVADKDFRPLTDDLAYNIRRGIQQFSFDSSVGVEDNIRGYIGCKNSADTSFNNRLLVSNKDFNCWEGLWLVPASQIVQHNTQIYYGNAYSGDVFLMSGVLNKTVGDDTFPMSCEAQTGWINKSGKGFYINEISTVIVEGYISAGSKIDIKMYKDFASDPFSSLQIEGTETEYIDNAPTFSLLGGSAGGLEPLGASAVLGDEEDDGRRHFIVNLNFQGVPVEYFSVGVGSSGKNNNWEVIALGINAEFTKYESQNRNKN